MSAPNSIGRQRYGVAKVLSIISGTPASWAILATFSISKTFKLGFPIVSAKIAFVFSVIAERKFSGSFGSTNLTLIPYFGRVTANKLYVPPYKLEAATISSPASAMFKIAM